jgi:hypothetical protein
MTCPASYPFFRDAFGSPPEWLALRAEEHRDDPDLYEALLRLSSHRDPRGLLVALGHSLGQPSPIERRDPAAARKVNGHG